MGKTQQNVKNLIEMKDQLSTLELLEKIKKAEKVTVSITPNGKGKQLTWNGKSMFVFDTCRCGNESYNAVSVIRDLLKKHHNTNQWTRKNVEPLVVFESKGSIGMQPFAEVKAEKVETQ